MGIVEENKLLAKGLSDALLREAELCATAAELRKSLLSVEKDRRYLQLELDRQASEITRLTEALASLEKECARWRQRARLA